LKEILKRDYSTKKVEKMPKTKFAGRINRELKDK
jgi:hypothetical protein